MGDFTDGFKSFVFQKIEMFDFAIKAKCTVHFRPHDGWEGEDYGFDWMRITDVNVFGDKKHYKNIISKHYKKGTKILETLTNEYEGTFEEDSLKFAQLETEYNPLLILSKPLQPPLATPKYYCSWLSLYPKNITILKAKFPSMYKNTKATLRLYLDIDESPDYLEFEDNEHFEITPKKITDDLGKGKHFWKQGATVTIECKSQFDKDQRINIFAYKKDTVTGQFVRKLAGRLYVWANDSSKLKNVKILLVKVTAPSFQTNKPPSIGNYTAKDKDVIGKYFRQALITATVEEYLPGLDLSTDAQFKNDYITSGKFDTGKQAPNYMDGYFYSKLQNELQKAGKNVNLYNDYYRIFYVGGKDVLGCAAYSLGNNIVVYDYPNQPDATLDHELLHSFKIDHSFSNQHYSESPNALYTYEAKKTENVMDYSHLDGEKCFALWHWQWNIANNSI